MLSEQRGSKHVNTTYWSSQNSTNGLKYSIETFHPLIHFLQLWEIFNRTWHGSCNVSARIRWDQVLTVSYFVSVSCWINTDLSFKRGNNVSVFLKTAQLNPSLPPATYPLREMLKKLMKGAWKPPRQKYLKYTVKNASLFDVGFWQYVSDVFDLDIELYV